jgi:hypothetical protein
LFKRTTNFYNFVRSYLLFWRKTSFTNKKFLFINLENREIILPAKTTKGGILFKKIIIDNGLFEISKKYESLICFQKIIFYLVLENPSKGNIEV